MARTMTPEQLIKAAELAAEIQAMSADVIKEVAEILTTTPDEKLFGDTEFVIRSHVMKILATSFSAHLAQKKTAISEAQATALTASELQSSKATATEIP
jgi:hypothetical protein